MGQATFSYYYQVSSGKITAIVTSQFEIEFEGSRLDVDEVVYVSGTEYIYRGLTENSDPLIQFLGNGSVGILSNYNGYGVGDDMPSWSAVDFVPCFLADTLIATPGGLVPIEQIRRGDLVVTSSGHAVPVRWVGRASRATMFVPLDALAVRISASSLGDGLPSRDLCVTPDHALLIDGLLVQAGALVNGTTIRRMTATELGERYTVFHIETECHKLILAEGVAAETFVDNVTRRRFDNYAEFEALYGEEKAAIAEMELPRVKSARQLPPAIRERIAARAAAPVPAASVAA